MRLINTTNLRAEERPRVLLVSPHSSYRIVPYLRAAERLGIELLVVSQGRHSPISAVASGLHVDLSDLEKALRKILETLADKPVVGVIGTDDATVELAARISAALGLVHNDPQATRLSRRKDLARLRLKRCGIPVPDFRCLSLASILRDEPPALEFPVVIKPVCLSGSRGVIRANGAEELKEAAGRIEKILRTEECLSQREQSHVLIEQYIHGPEYAFEGLLSQGQLHRLALFDKPDIMAGPYFEETYYITPSRLSREMQVRIGVRLEQACAAYGLREGPVHAEVRICDDEVWIMELAARTIGGQCARLLRFGTGHSLEELVLWHAIGRRVELEEIAGAAGVLMIPITQGGILRRVEGLLAAQRQPYIEDIEISVPEGYELVPLPESSGYLGFIFSRAPEPYQAEQALRLAYRQLKFVTAPLLAAQVMSI